MKWVKILKRTIIFSMLILMISVLVFSSKESVSLRVLKHVSRLHGDELIQKFYPITEKFWLHRSNSIEKIEELFDKYDGVELDIIFFDRQNNFDVSHDLNENIDYPLDSFLPILATTKNKIWFDFKNLSKDNAMQSSDLLSDMLNRNNINKNEVIVESRDYNALKYFKEKGFYTSFYCPVDDKYLNTKEGNDLFISSVFKAVSSGNIDAISFPIAYYPLVKSANIKTDMLTWNQNKKWFYFYFDQELQKVINDQQVKVILVKDSASINR